MSHFGIRGPEFINYLSNIFTIGKLKPEYIELLTEQDSLEMYISAFTSPSVNSNQNYESLEFLGDSTINKIIVWYLSRRFPQLMNKENVKTLARLKINLISKTTFSKIGRDLHIEQFITCTEDEWIKSQTKLIEDSLEALFGAIEYQIDSKIKIGAGYAICYNIMKPLLDKMDISLEYEDLYDSVTRLKEVFDIFQKILGKVEYKTVQDENKMFTTNIYSIIEQKPSITNDKSKSIEMTAADNAIKTFNSTIYSIIEQKKAVVSSSNTDRIIKLAEISAAENAIKTFNSAIYTIFNQKRTLIGTAIGKSSKAAEIAAAENAIVFLENKGFVRIRDNTDYIQKLPENISITTDSHGLYYQTTITYKNNQSIGVGFTQQESINRAAYNILK